jgi:two-component system, chemotaxis family, CheB/CheR fusion protein
MHGACTTRMHAFRAFRQAPPWGRRRFRAWSCEAYAGLRHRRLGRRRAGAPGVLRADRSDLGIAYVVIMHLSPEHESQMSEILSARTSMPVRQVDDAEARAELRLRHRPRPGAGDRRQRRALAPLLRAARPARADRHVLPLRRRGARATASAWCSAARDRTGRWACGKIKEAGGVVFVQDPREAEFADDAASAIATGVADFVEPIDRSSRRIAEVAKSKARCAADHEEEAEEDVRRIIAFLHAAPGTTSRATRRRRSCGGSRAGCRWRGRTASATMPTTSRENPEEAQELLGDLLISVTMPSSATRHAYETLARRRSRR